jgi:hypothetical protein
MRLEVVACEPLDVRGRKGLTIDLDRQPDHLTRGSLVQALLYKLDPLNYI